MVLGCQVLTCFCHLKWTKEIFLKLSRTFLSLCDVCLPFPGAASFLILFSGNGNYQSAELSAGSYRPHRAGPSPGAWVRLELWEIDSITLVIILHLAMHICLLQRTINHGKGRAHGCVSARKRSWQVEWFLTSSWSQAFIQPFQHDSILLTINVIFLLHWFECWLRCKAYFLEQQEM